MMDKIKISRKGKKILLSLCKGEYPSEVPDSDIAEFNVLECDGLVKSATCKGENRPMIVCPRLTDEGRAYLTVNPKLRNPKIWDDKKYVINTLISITALTISIIALLK